MIEMSDYHRCSPKLRSTEFMAICAIIRAPGRLMFDNQQGTFEKIMPYTISWQNREQHTR